MTKHLPAVLSRWVRMPMAFLALAALPLMAQLNPALKVAETDFLDMFQRTSAQVIKPEILTVLDFSGSMNAMMWHPSYYANATQDNHLPTDWSGGDDSDVLPYVKSFSSTTGPLITFKAYQPNRTTATSITLTPGPLVRADGELVTASDVTGSTSRVADWISVATHVRIKASYNGVERTVDLPIPYTIFDSPAGTPDSSATASYALDPQNSNAVTKFDSGTAVVQNYSATGYYNDYASIGWIGHFWYNHDYFYWLFFGKDEANDPVNPNGSKDTSDYIVSNSSSKKAFKNGIPALTRYQGVKRAVIMTWLANQSKVYWGFRFLDVGEQDKDAVDPGNGNQSGTDRNLRILGKATSTNVAHPSVRALQDALPWNGTPLTYAMANALAQLNVNKNSIFDTPHTSDKYTSPQCQTAFVFLFTDGIANDSYGQDRYGRTISAIGANTPYPTEPPSTRCNASVGNKQVALDGVGALNPHNKDFNIWTLAAVAAHGGDPALNPDIVATPATVTTYPTDSAQAPSRFAPFFIKKRGNGTAYSTTFNTARPVQTFTIGVSLGGSYDEVNSAKYQLLLTAASGDPAQTSWDIKKARAYSASNTGTFFFDARDPGSLANSIGSAIQSAVEISNKQTTASPSIPFSGVALAAQVYVGQFKPPSTPGPMWSGDLMMFPTRTENLNQSLLAANGSPLEYLDCSTAMWSVARDVFNVASASATGGGSAGKGCTAAGSGTGTGTAGCGPASLASPINWSARKIYTRLPATSSVPNPDLIAFTDADPAFSVFKGNLPSGLDDAAKQALVNFVRGADNDSTATPKANRTNIMGDVIDSVPTAMEYKWSGVTFKNSLPSNVKTALDAHSDAHLRLIFVGTNQGFLHAFAEASWPVSQTPPGGTTPINVTTAVVGELWAFMPTDFLPYLDYLQNKTGLNTTHYYMVNGAPFVYTLDLPTTTSVAGDGMVENTEKAMVIFGLRKGGRSYYALDVHDPTDPHIAWVINAEEAATIPDTRVLSGGGAAVRTLVGNMGYSTSALLPGRVIFGSKIRDVLLLGGGLSTDALDTKFSNTALGRSVVGVDILTGEILQTWNLLTLSGLTGSVVGSVGTGVVPFRTYLNSDMHQRAYFADLKGSIWALGSGKTNVGEPMKDFRVDSSEMDKWVTNSGGLSLRRLYADTSANGIITTTPAPFLLADFPVNSASTTNTVHPTAVGIPFVTGNRFNPLDFNYTSTTAPTRHRYNVIFDRQDSKITGVDSSPITTTNMTDFSSSNDATVDALNPTKSTYYLKSKYGYYVNFPAATLDTSTGKNIYFISKGITDPTVLAYATWYSYFTPTSSDPCQGGSGTTNSYAICNVINPVVDSSATPGDKCASGMRATWSGVASNFSAIGTVAVIQAGMVIPATPPPSGDSTIMALKTLAGNVQERYPRVKVWRTVH